MAEKKKKATKKKVSKKKTAKKVLRKKVVKKALSKKVTKKTDKRKAAKKVLRKKTTQKKPIKLKADSPDLDSFAAHAAENVEAIEAAAVSLEATTANDDTKSKTQPKKTAEAKSTKPVTPKTAPAKKEDKITETKVSSATKSKPEYKKTTPITPSVTTRPSRGSSATTDESLKGRLIIAGLLFLGVGVYLISIFNEDTASQSTVKATLVSKNQTGKTAPAPKLSQAVPATKVSEQPTVETELDKTKPIKSSGAAVISEQGSPQTADDVKTLTQAVNKEASKQTVAKIGPEQAGDGIKRFPPPPTPDFLQNTAVKVKPLPENQMELIKELFAPELK